MRVLAIIVATSVPLLIYSGMSQAADPTPMDALADDYSEVDDATGDIRSETSDATITHTDSGALSATPKNRTPYPKGEFATDVDPTKITSPSASDPWTTFVFPSGTFRVRLAGEFTPNASQVNGNQLTLTDIRSGIDSHYAISDEGIEEFLHVDSASPAHSFTWQYQLPKGWYVGDDGDGLQVFDQNGWIVLVFRADWAQTSTGTVKAPEIKHDAIADSISVDVPANVANNEYVLDPHWAVASSFDDHAYQWKTCGSTGESSPSCRSTGTTPQQWTQQTSSGDSSKYAVGYTTDEAFRIYALGSQTFADTSWAQWKYTPVTGTVIDQIAWNGRQNNVSGTPGASPFRCGLRGWQSSTMSEDLIGTGGTFDVYPSQILRAGSIGSGQSFDSAAFAMVHDGTGNFTSASDPLNNCHVRRLDSDLETQQLHLILIDNSTPSITGSPTVTSAASDTVVGPNDLPHLRVTVSEQGSGIDLAHWSTDDGSAGLTTGSTDYCTEEDNNGTGDDSRPCSLSVSADPDIIPTSAALTGTDGTRGIDITVEDFASNTSSPSSASVTWDETAPASITGPSISGLVTYGGTPYITDASAIGISWTGGSDAHAWKQQYQITTSACPTTIPDTGWTTAAGSATAAINSPAENTTYRLCVRSVDTANNITIASTTFQVDETPPLVSAVYDGPTVATDVDWVSATSQLSANWTSSDSGTGLADHEYCISTETGCSGTIFENWTSTALDTDMTADGQPVSISANYYTCVRATDNVGNTSSPICSDSVKVALPEIPRDGTTATDAQYQDSKTTLSINWDPLTTDSGSSFDWKLCSEIQCLVPIATGTTSSTTVTVSGISPTLTSGRYIGCVRSTDPYAYTGEYLCSNGVRVDADAPTMGTPRDGGAATDNDTLSIKSGGAITALTANWDEATDNIGGEGIDHYDWMFCTAVTCSGAEILAASPGGGTTNTSVSATISPTKTSGTLYACVRAVDGAGNESSYQCSDGATIGTVGGTNKSGTITSTNEVWTKAMSPINLTGNFTISTGSTLTIDAGVTVRATGGYQIRTSNGGALHANGTAAEPILFTRDADQGSAFGDGNCTSCSGLSNWLGFKLDTGINNIDHAVIRYVGVNSSSLMTVGSSGATTALDMDSVRITNTPAKFQAQNGAALTIESSYFDALSSLTATGSGTLLTATGLTITNGGSQNISIDSSAGADISESFITGSSTGLKLAGGAQADLTSTSVTGESTTGIDISGSGTAIDIEDATITGNGNGVRVASGNSVTIDNSTLSSNSVGLLADGTFAVTDTTIASNSSHGINYASTGMGTGMTGVVRNATIVNNGGTGIRGRVTSTGLYRISGSTISKNAGSGFYLLGNGTSVTGNPSILIANKITYNGPSGTGNYGIKIDGTFGASGDNTKWPAGHRNVVTHNGNNAYLGGGQISSDTMYPPTTSWASLPHWADNEWGAQPQAQPIGTRSNPFGANATRTPCDNTSFYSGKVWQYPTNPWINDTYPEVANSVWDYNTQSGVDTFCVQSKAKLPVAGTRRTTMMGTASTTSDVAKNFNIGGNGINTATGNYTETRTDIANPSDLGSPLKIERTYNSTSTETSVLGRGWTWNLGASIDVSDPTVAVNVLLEDGTGIEYYALGGNDYGSPTGTRSTFKSVGSPVTSYVLTRTDNSALTFDTNGRLVSKLDRNGHGVELAYTGASPRPDTATDEAGHTYTFSYDGNNKLEEVSSSDGRTVEYDIVGEELRTVTDVRGKTWTYAYDSGLVESLTSPEGRELFHNDYGSERDVTSQTDANGKATTLSRNTTTGVSTVTDPAGKSTADSYSDGKLTNSTDAMGRSTSFAYDNRNNPKAITDTNGGITKLTYDAHGNVTKRVTPAPFNYVERYKYDADNNVTEKVDGRGNVTHYEYDGAGNLRYEKRQDGAAPGGIDQNVTEYVLNADKQVEEVIDARGKSTYRDYDPTTHYLVSESAELGEPKTYDHDAVGRVTEVIDPVGNASGNTPADYTTTTAYDEAGNILSVENPYGDETHKSYDDDGRLEYELDEAGERTDYEYDDAGHVTKITEPQIGSDPRRFTRKLYDKRGLLIKQIDQLGRITTYTYNAAGQRTSTVSPKGNSGNVDPDKYRTRYVYDAAGHLTDTIDPLGNTTSSEYDALGRVTRRSNARFEDTQYRYDANGNVIAIINNAGATATREYDQLNRLVARSDFRGNITRLEYNKVGKITKERTPEQIAQTPDGATTYCYDDNERRSAIIGPRAGDIACGTANDYQTDFTYDEAGRLTSTTNPEGNTTSTTYDRAGRKASQTDGEDHTTHFRYTNTGRLHEVEAPPHPMLGDRITSYDYNEAGDLVTRTNANADVTTYEYDAAHQLIGKVMPNSSEWTYGYDLNGNHTSTVDANGTATTGTPGDGTTEYAFDRADRIVGIDYSDSTPDVSYELTPTGQVAQATAGSITEDYDYNGLDQLTGVERGIEQFTYGYDADGNITSRTYPGQSAVAYAYDGDGRLEQVGSGGGTTTYGYDDAGNRTTTDLPNGIVETRTYDDADRLTEIESVDGPTTVEDVSYTLDGVGNPLTKNTLSSTEVYSYDEMNQLKSVCFQSLCPDPEDDQITFDYDKVGKRLNATVGNGTTSVTTTYCYGADSDQLLGTITVGTCLGLTPDRTYDANGNLTSDATRDYTYDLENRVTSIDDGTTVTNYGYDADGKRVSSDDGTTAREYYWDTTYQDAQLAVNTDGTTVRSYRYGHGRISTTDGTDEQYFLADRIGSVMHVTDANADIDWSYEYDPFGNVRNATHVDPLSPDNDMQYAGEQLDPTGLTYLRARQYDPTVGEFTGIDPIEHRNEIDLEDPFVSAYIYADNDPTRMTDPSGEIVIPSPEVNAQIQFNLTMALATVTACGLLEFGSAGTATIAMLPCAARAMAYIWASYALLRAGADVATQIVESGGINTPTIHHSSDGSDHSGEHSSTGDGASEGRGDWRADGASESADEIADKAWEKHRKEFPEFNDKDQLAGHVKDVIDNPASEVATNGEKTAWRDPDGTIVISDPQRTANPGSVYRPDPPGTGWPPIGFS